MNTPIDIMQHLITTDERKDLMGNFIHCLKKHMKKNCNGFIICSWNANDEMMIHGDTLVEISEAQTADAIEDFMLKMLRE